MNEEILKAIANSLPAMQMEVLKQELEKASRFQKVKEELDDCQKLLRQANDKVRELTLLEADMKKSLSESQSMKSQLDMELLKKDLACAKEVAANIKELAMAAFRNPTVTKTFNHSSPTGYNSGSETTTAF